MLLYKYKLVLDFHEIYKNLLHKLIRVSNKISPPFRGFDQIFDALLASSQIHRAL